MLSKIAIGLGFDSKLVSTVVHRALKLVSEKSNYSRFKDDITKLL